MGDSELLEAGSFSSSWFCLPSSPDDLSPELAESPSTNSLKLFCVHAVARLPLSK